MKKILSIIFILFSLSGLCFADQNFTSTVNFQATANFTNNFKVSRSSTENYLSIHQYPTFSTSHLVLNNFRDLNTPTASFLGDVVFRIDNPSSTINVSGPHPRYPPYAGINLTCGLEAVGQWFIRAHNANNTVYQSGLTIANDWSNTPNITMFNPLVVSSDVTASITLQTNTVQTSGETAKPSQVIAFRSPSGNVSALIGTYQDSGGVGNLAIKSNWTVYLYSNFTEGVGPIYRSASGYFTTTNPSDISLKKNIRLVSEGQAQKMLSLLPKEYDWISNGCHGVGFIAQDLELVYPELVNTMPDGKKGIYSDRLVPLLIKAFQEEHFASKAKIDDLEARLKALEEK